MEGVRGDGYQYSGDGVAGADAVVGRLAETD